MCLKKILFVCFGNITIYTFCNDFDYGDLSDFNSDKNKVKPGADIVEIIDKEDLGDVFFNNNKKNTKENIEDEIDSEENKDENKQTNNIKELQKEVDIIDENKPTMYENLFENVEFSDEEKKMIGLEEPDKKNYTLKDAKWITFGDIKYREIIHWKNIGRKRIDLFDLYTKEQESIFTIQDLGMVGSPSKYLVPVKIKDVSLDLGYNGYDIYKRDINDIIFFDTKMPLGEINSTFNLDSGDGFNLSVKTYYSKNKNIHFGFNLNLLFKGRNWEKVYDNKYKTAIKNFPISTYFLYRGDNDKLLWLLNLDVNNFIHSDFGGILLEGPEMIGQLDDTITNNSGEEVLKHLIDAKLLGYFQYKFPKIYLYLQYILNYQNNSIEFNYLKEEKEKEIENGTIKVKEVILKKNKISAKTKGRFFNSMDGDDYLAFINNDKFIKTGLEVGVKNNILLNNTIDFNYNAYYIFKFLTRNISEKVFTDENLKNVQKNDILQRRYYFIPITIGGNIEVLNINLNTELSYTENNLFTKVDIGYQMKYFGVNICFSRYQIPLIFREYVCHSENVRQYNITKEDDEDKKFKTPMDIFLDLNGFFNIKNVILNPYIKSVLNINKLYFGRVYDDDDKNISEPKQMKNLLLHTNLGLDFYVNFLRYWTINSNIFFNFKKKLGKDEEDNENCEKLNNIPLFNFYIRGYFNKTFSNDVEVKAGVEFFFRTKFSPDFYDIFNQQFASQTYDFEFTYWTKPILNTYCNFRFGNFVGMLKFNLLNMFIDKYGMSTFNYPNNNDVYMLSLKYIIY